LTIIAHGFWVLITEFPKCFSKEELFLSLWYEPALTSLEQKEANHGPVYLYASSALTLAFVVLKAKSRLVTSKMFAPSQQLNITEMKYGQPRNKIYCDE
jgi:hypothetical protein